MTASTVAAVSATISTSETLQSVASSVAIRKPVIPAGWWRSRTFASWALPIVLLFRQAFERDQDLLAEFEQLVPAGIAAVVVPCGVGLGKFRQMNARQAFQTSTGR